MLCYPKLNRIGESLFNMIRKTFIYFLLSVLFSISYFVSYYFSNIISEYPYLLICISIFIISPILSFLFIVESIDIITKHSYSNLYGYSYPVLIVFVLLSYFSYFTFIFMLVLWFVYIRLLMREVLC